MGIHKRLKQYSVIAGGKLSKVIAFSKGEAEIFVKNFIETHLSHAVLKAAGGLKNVTAYFCDVKYLKEQLNTQVNRLISGIDTKITDIETKLEGGDISAGGSGSGTAFLTEAQRIALEEQKTILEQAKDKLRLAKESVTSVQDDSDFNKEDIDRAKGYVSDTIDDLKEKGITSLTIPATDDDADSTISLDTEKRKIGNNLNRLRKWQLDKFEEEYSAELYIGAYHEYKYAKTIEELCDLINTALKSLNVDLILKASDYQRSGTEVIRKDNGEKNIEEDITAALQEKNIKFKRIDIDWHDKNFEPDSEDAFTY